MSVRQSEDETRIDLGPSGDISGCTSDDGHRESARFAYDGRSCFGGRGEDEERGSRDPRERFVARQEPREVNTSVEPFGERNERSALRSITDDDERQAASRASFDSEMHPFVRDQAAHRDGERSGGVEIK